MMMTRLFDMKKWVPAMLLLALATSPAHAITPPKVTGTPSLIDAGGLEYLINPDLYEGDYLDPQNTTDQNGAPVVSDLDDAFDRYGSLTVTTSASGTVAYDPTGALTTDCSGRQVLFPAQAIGSLNVSRRIYVPADDQFARIVDTFTNTGGTPVSVTTQLDSDLGSDAHTLILGSSSGDTVASNADDWIATGGDYNDPRLAHVLSGPGGAATRGAVSVTAGSDQTSWSYTFSVAPGKTVNIMTFVSGQPDENTALAQAARLAGLPATTNACLSASDLLGVANFGRDLSLTNTDSPDPVQGGGPVSYTLSVVNNSALSAEVSVTDTTSAGTISSASGSGWSCGAPGGVSITCTADAPASVALPLLTITVTAPTTPQTFTNTATLTVLQGDSDSSNDTAIATTTVCGKATTTALTAVPSSSAEGQSVTFTAAVASTCGSGTPTGQVTFMDGATSLGSASLSSGSASVTVPTLAAGTHDVTATYGGDANFDGSSGSLTYTVTCPGIRGDANGDNAVAPTDIFYLVNFLFAGGPPPAVNCRGDANHDFATTPADIFYLVNFLFAGGPAPN